MDYKRNQVEEAISRVLEPGSKKKPSSEMRTRLKRLLDVDRAFGRNKRSADAKHANFAFYNTDALGRGVEHWFSGYGVFALLMGLRLLQHGWPQRFAVALLRYIRPELEKHHGQILQRDSTEISDPRRMQAQPMEGDLATPGSDPVFLAIRGKDREDQLRPVAEICRGQGELMNALLRNHEVGQTWTTFELANSARALDSELAKTVPRRRGRSSN